MDQPWLSLVLFGVVWQTRFGTEQCASKYWTPLRLTFARPAAKCRSRRQPIRGSI